MKNRKDKYKIIRRPSWSRFTSERLLVSEYVIIKDSSGNQYLVEMNCCDKKIGDFINENDFYKEGFNEDGRNTRMSYM